MLERTTHGKSETDIMEEIHENNGRNPQRFLASGIFLPVSDFP